MASDEEDWAIGDLVDAEAKERVAAKRRFCNL